MNGFDQKDLDMYYENLRDSDDDTYNEDPPIDVLIDDLEYNDDFIQEYDDYIERTYREDTSITYREFAYNWLIKKGIIYG